MNPKSSDAELWSALDQAAAADLVRNLPSGLDTLVGNRAVRLSGRERQRIALARIFLRRPTFLVLDEATSALDNTNVRLVQPAIHSLHSTMTILTVAHRLSTIRTADQIIVLEFGRIAQTGSWTQLTMDNVRETSPNDREFRHLTPYFLVRSSPASHAPHSHCPVTQLHDPRELPPISVPDNSTLARSEYDRLAADARREVHWKRWGPYLADRQWGTVREDYSANGDAWNYFPHDHAAARAYCWGEDGLLGLSDAKGRLCFGVSLWNEHDPILKERLFGLTGHEGNHGEDVKEVYPHLASTPSHSWIETLYKYPQSAYPYAELVAENRRRDRTQPEYELADTGALDENRYFDVFIRYAKAGANDILIEIEVANRGPNPARIHILPTWWYRNSWVWGCAHEGCELKPVIKADGAGHARGDQESLGPWLFAVEDNSLPW
ncbi:MAG: ATP-binding cassette domain-containing protein [Candidatus Synoicihabitans palmerolidicus]|nr:ATP-binding cassette domain-containing protein [Candidatus Synoicihabitans palmerolidicus]